MRRLFWAALGAAAGAVLVRRAQRVISSYSPQGVGRVLSGLPGAARDLADEVRRGMAEREEQLRAALEADAGMGGAEGGAGPRPESRSTRSYDPSI